MCNFSDSIERRSMAQGENERTYKLLSRVMATKGMNFDEAAEHLCLTAEEVEAVRPMFAKD